MKNYILTITTLFCICLTACAQTTKQSAASEFEKLKWLVGSWGRTNEKAGRTSFEHWNKPAGTEISGQGVTLKGSDTVFVEKFKIVVKNNELFYIADVPGNKEPVPFKLTSVTDDGFLCENPQHDFPKMIRYTKEVNGMKATISGNGKSVDFLFARL